jgi:hypothetical protein
MYAIMYRRKYLMIRRAARLAGEGSLWRIRGNGHHVNRMKGIVDRSLICGITKTAETREKRAVHAVNSFKLASTRGCTSFVIF